MNGRNCILGRRRNLFADFAHTTCKMSTLARGACSFGLFPLRFGLVSPFGHCHSVAVIRLIRVFGRGFSAVLRILLSNRLMILAVKAIVGRAASGTGGGVAVIIWILGRHEDPQARTPNYKSANKAAVGKADLDYGAVAYCA